jgi:hypothetical protein
MHVVMHTLEIRRLCTVMSTMLCCSHLAPILCWLNRDGLPTMAEPPNKRARLTDLGRDSHLTNSALAAVLRQVRDDGMPEAFSETTQRRHRRQVAETSTIFGPILQTVSVKGTSRQSLQIHVQHPLAMLAATVEKSTRFRELLRATLQQHNNRISICLYSDEITPGNVLATRNDRQIQAIYWTIIQLGAAALSDEANWFTISAIQSSTVKQLSGGMSQVFKVLLRLFFGKPDGHDLRDGVVLPIPGDSSHRLIFGSLGLLVQDERAHKEATYMKGASGNKICGLCQNVIRHRCSILPDPTGFCIPATCFEMDKIVPQTDATIKAIQRRLRAVAASGTHAELEKVQRDLGYVFSPDGFLQDTDLDINLVSAFMWDWMHVYVSDGVFSSELKELMCCLGRAGLGGNSFNTYLQHWVWPKGYASADKLCSPSASSTDHSPSGSASEMLSVAPVLAKYLQDVVAQTQTAPDEVASALALCRVVVLLSVVAHGLVCPDMLEGAIVEHLRLHQVAYGETLWRPKHHFAVHLPGMLSKHGTLISSFVMERKHRVLKRMANPRHNTTSFAKGLLEDVTLQHLYDLEQPPSPTELLEPRPANNKLLEVVRGQFRHVEGDSVLTGRVVKVHSRSVCMGDVVVYSNGPTLPIGIGEVWFHVQVGGQLMSCVSAWEMVALQPTSAKCRVREAPRFVESSSLLESAIYAPAKPGQIAQVLLPFRCQ